MIYDEAFLSHHGVKGQKWGVLRTPEQLGHRIIKRQEKIDKRNSSMNKISSIHKKDDKRVLKRNEKDLKKIAKDLNRLRTTEKGKEIAKQIILHYNRKYKNI